MKKALIALATTTLAPSVLHAGGIDRSGQGVNILFEEGNAVQFSIGYAMPNVSGDNNGVPTGNVGNNFSMPSASYKAALSEKLDFAIIYDRPFGADTTYKSGIPASINPLNPTAPSSLFANASSDAITALLRYKFGNGFSFYGGARAQRLQGTVSVPNALGYYVKTDDTTDFGYTLGVAWEKPEIAARVALTYNSKITHSFKQNEIGTNPATFRPFNVETESEVTTPQSINLDFQTGVAPKTIVFGTVRWVDWPQFSWSPPNFPSPDGVLVDYDQSTWSYSLGVGRQLTENFAGAISLVYEPQEGGITPALGPTDGLWAVAVGGTYDIGKAQISGGVRYTKLGDATVENVGEFSGNDSWGVGFQITYALD